MRDEALNDCKVADSPGRPTLTVVNWEGDLPLTLAEFRRLTPDAREFLIYSMLLDHLKAHEDDKHKSTSTRRWRVMAIAAYGALLITAGNLVIGRH
jgi:hypothetical protein